MVASIMPPSSSCMAFSSSLISRSKGLPRRRIHLFAEFVEIGQGIQQVLLRAGHALGQVFQISHFGAFANILCKHCHVIKLRLGRLLLRQRLIERRLGALRAADHSGRWRLRGEV